MNEAGLSVQQVAQEAGVAASTVRLYARRGLLTADRTAGNARRFDYDAPCRIVIAKASQRAGMDLSSIAHLLRGLPRNAERSDWDELNRQIIEAADRHITKLRAVVEDVSERAPLASLPLAPEDVRARRAQS